ncbi:Exosome complex protein LRP1 [Nakaseomyces bracarensis]|uniref:Exosome complex protein n=1 Tax=Nakaseomyces bracarensis TaxID=273131 RepID=A0ABR4NTT1_9SACH
MEQDLKKSVKPYIKQLDRKLAELKPLVDGYMTTPLDEALLRETDELKRLKLVNNYSYVLSSLMFSYVKLLSGHDTEGLNDKVMVELQRVRKYIERTKKLEQKLDKNVSDEELRKKEVQGQIRKTLTPSISKQNFKNKHIKFDDNRVSKK